MTWLARLKKTTVGPETDPAKPTKPPFAGFAGTPPGLSQNSWGGGSAANDPARAQEFDREDFEERAAIIEFDGGLSRTEAEALAADGITCDPDRHCWPHTSAENSAELESFIARVQLFIGRGLDYTEAETLADSLVIRDREDDDLRLCLECRHLRGGGTSWTCNQWRRAGLAVSGVPAEVVRLPQRCAGFTS